MGRQAYAIGGGLIGAGIAFFATGGTATLQGYEAGFALGAAVGGIAGSYIDPIVLQGNKVGDNSIQVAAEGGARALMFGTCCVTATCIIARGNRQVHKNKTSNGKGSSGSTTNETVTWSFAIALGETIKGAAITRIWQDETLVYDVTGSGQLSSNDNAKFAGKFRFYDGNESQLPDSDLQTFLGADTPYFRGTAYVVFPNFDLTQTAERIPTFRFEVAAAGYEPSTQPRIGLDGVVADLLMRAGMTQDQFDTSALTDRIAGVCIEQTSNGTDAVNSVVQPYFADPCERDALLTFVKRGAPVLRTLTIDDLTEEPDAPSRENAIEYPAKLSFFYQSPQTAYAQTKATSSRYSEQSLSSGEGSATAPITFYDADEPAQIAAKLHKVMWTEAEGSFVWSTGIQCIDLVPTDTLGLFLRGVVNRARITNTEFDGRTVKLTMVKDRQSSYTSNVTAVPLPASTAPRPSSMSKAVLAVLDIPALTDSDDFLLYYTAMSGTTQVWNGGQLQRSLDDGSTWSTIGDVTTDSTMGRLTMPMTAADLEYTDTTNSVVVQLFDSRNDLLAYSDTTFLQEQGAIAIQLADGTWEVLQYRDATDGGSGLWTLSYLQRGRLNTVAGAHAIGALFVLLDSTLARNSAQVAWLGGTLKHRAVSYGTSVEDADVVSTTYVGRSQREWSPANAAAEYDGTWLYLYDIVARERFGTEVAPIASTNFSGFRVIATDGTTSVNADISSGTSAHVNTSPLSHVTSVSIAALNRITGAGDAISVAPVLVAAGSLTPTGVINGGGSTLPPPPPPPGPPTVNFSGTPLSGNTTLAVSFTDLTNQTPSAWAWTFGDGGTSTAQNPTHSYTSAGTYDVSLTVTVRGVDYNNTKTAYVVASTPSGDPYFSNVSLLLHFNGTNGATSTSDTSSSARTISIVNGTLSSSQAKFGATSLHVTGTGGAQIGATSSPPDNLQLAHSEFTIEVWIYPTADAAGYICNMNSSNTFSPVTIIFTSSGLVRVQATNSSNTLVGPADSDSAVSLNAWHFVQVRRRNGVGTGGSDNIEFAIDGTAQTGFLNLSSGTNLYPTHEIDIGSTGGVTFPFVGYIDEFRLTNGIARAFNLPTTAFLDF